MLRRIFVILALLLVCFSESSLAADGQNYFKFQIGSKSELHKLTRIISIDGIDGMTVYAYANDREFAEFQRLGYSYEILPDPGTLIMPEMSDSPGLLLDWDTYPTYQAYIDMMNQFAIDYPELCVIENIGSSVEGRALLAAKISANIDLEENEPEVFYTSSMHGDETTGYVLMLRLIDYLLSNYGTDPRATAILDTMEVYINPLANPDGSYNGGNNTIYGAIRYNANGVDLNRNFPDPEDGPHPDGNSYQPETIAMMNYGRLHNFVISANFHGGAEVVNYPWDTWPIRHADDSWWINICHQYADTCQANSPSGYLDGFNDGITNGYDWYEVNGGRQDYYNYWLGCREITIEISNTKLLPAGQLPAHWNYNWRSFLRFIEQANFGIRGIVTDASTSEPLAATITVLNHDIDSSRVFTDPNLGNYHRMLAAGTYNLRFTSPGYIPQTINNVVVSNNNITVVDVQLQAMPNEPVLSFYSHNAGIVDPGDSVMMRITIVNDGGGNANGVNAVLSTEDGYLTVNQDSSSYPMIPGLGGLGISNSNYRFDVSPSCPEQHQVDFRLIMSASGGFVDTSYFSIVVGLDIENFETGNFTSFPWQFGGNLPWTVTSLQHYEGIYCAQSGAISHNQTSEMRLTLDIGAVGTLSFFYRVSSEAGYDYLRFYIDNVLQNQWSGEVPWTEISYYIGSGSHTFKWVYYKDNTVHGGSDKAWIDFIVFPPLYQQLQIITPSLPDWTFNYSYSHQLEAVGGVGNKTWSDLNNNLIGTGLSLNSDGLLSGIPAVQGQIGFTARVEDDINNFADRFFAFNINPALEITTELIPNGIEGIPFNFQLLATGGTGQRTWLDRDNNLAGSGLTISSGGLLSGTPLTEGILSFLAQVTDSIGANDTSRFQFEIISGGGSYVPGDVNNTGNVNGLDVTYLINYFKGGNVPPLQIDCPPHGLFYAACDVNGNCSVNGLDATYLVNYLKGSSAPMYCADCPPQELLTQDEK